MTCVLLAYSIILSIISRQCWLALARSYVCSSLLALFFDKFVNCLDFSSLLFRLSTPHNGCNRSSNMFVFVDGSIVTAVCTSVEARAAS